MVSGFVTETEAAEARLRRQEEWEKVRMPDQPMERPEEPYDGRSLYDRLKEQKMKKDMEYEETHKLKNLIRGLDDDEVQFLELVDKTKMDAEKQQMKEEEKELKEFRNRVATLQEESVDKKIQAEIKSHKANTNLATRPTQKSLLGIGIKRKNGDIASSSAKAAKVAPTPTPAPAPTPTTTTTTTSKACVVVDEKKQPLQSPPAPLANITTQQFDKGQLKCVAILPGIGPYTESSDSEMSSGSDDEPDTQGRYDLVGRKRQKRRHCQEE